MARKKKPARTTKPQKRPPAGSLRRRSTIASAALPTGGPVTLEQARAMVQVSAPQHAIRRQGGALPAASPGSVGVERKKLALERRRENERRIREYAAILEILKQRGVKGLTDPARPVARGARRRGPGGGGEATALHAPVAQPLQIFAEGDSWFDYPVPFFDGGIIPRLEDRLGVPVLNLAKAGDEVRFMLGVEERRILTTQLTNGCPAGGPWDVLLFSGGGNDIVDNPMALWIRDYDAALPAAGLIHQTRLDAALSLVRAGYEDLIALRDKFSPTTHLVFHAYDFAIPDGRGICHLGPWLKPTFDLRGFPTRTAAFDVVKEMLKQFAALMQSFESHHAVTFINGQGTLVPDPKSWHNELHPSRDGFEKFADLFHARLKALFPGRVL